MELPLIAVANADVRGKKLDFKPDSAHKSMFSCRPAGKQMTFSRKVFSFGDVLKLSSFQQNTNALKVLVV